MYIYLSVTWRGGNILDWTVSLNNLYIEVLTPQDLRMWLYLGIGQIS